MYLFLMDRCVKLLLSGTDFCSRGHDCHLNATCVNLDTRYACQCRAGFHGDGRECEGKSVLIYVLLNMEVLLVKWSCLLASGVINWQFWFFPGMSGYM